MSTIVCDGNIIAVDMINIINGTKHNVPSDNIYVLDTNSEPVEHVIVVCIGDKAQSAYFVENFNNLRDSAVVQKFRAIFGEANFTSYVYYTVDKSSEMYHGLQYAGSCSTTCMSIGSGAKYALGALEAGADAITALKVAAKYDLYTDSKDIQYVDLIKPSVEVRYLAYQ